MRMYDIIRKKRDGEKLSKEEIAFFVKEYTKGNIPDYQASALAMAIFFNKMDKKETAILTDEMAHSGDMLDLSKLGEKTVDKHSSGGVGDKTTLIVAPIAAAAGCTVAKMSGKGLGFTGGTIDKLESISSLTTSMTPNKFFEIAKKANIVVAGQTGNMAPADKKLYSLRDVTATVDCMPLIASSIMSKKLAAGSKNIVLDVKCGNGAFMKNEADATVLANEMVSIGKSCGRNISAFITNMSTPLGYNIGNTLEVIEAVDILNGKKVDDLLEICLTLSGEMISLCHKISFDDGYNLAKEMLDSKKALDKFKQMVELQGGDVDLINDTSKFKKAKYTFEYKFNHSGFVKNIDALTLGRISVLLGAGRATKDDMIDDEAGIVLSKKEGDSINCGDTILTLHSNSKDKIELAKNELDSAITVSKTKPQKRPLILKVIR